MTHHPYLQITLSTSPLGLEDGEAGRNVSCQYVLAKRKRGAAAKTFVTDDVADKLVALDQEEGDGKAEGRTQARRQKAPPKSRGPGALVKGQKRKSETDVGSGGKRSKGSTGDIKRKPAAI